MNDNDRDVPVTAVSVPNWAKYLAVLGTAVAAAVLPGLLLFALGLTQVVGELTDPGPGNPGIVSDGLTDALVPLLISAIVGAVGFALVCFVAMFTRYRARWFFWSCVLCCIFYAPYIPYGTVMAAILLVFLVKKRHEFLRQN